MFEGLFFGTRVEDTPVLADDVVSALKEQVHEIPSPTVPDYESELTH